jgi:hypothetical protein
MVAATAAEETGGGTRVTIRCRPAKVRTKSSRSSRIHANPSQANASSTRDGMNLVSYEYIARQEQRHGVMILSEFAGAAQRPRYVQCLHDRQ